jgi:hypothetical protein
MAPWSPQKRQRVRIALRLLTAVTMARRPAHVKAFVAQRRADSDEDRILVVTRRILVRLG